MNAIDTGSMAISAHMSVLDIISEYPEAEAIFRSYDEQVGGCICCQMLFETVQDIVEKYQLNLPELLDKLNSVVTD